jgi:hypothetical protein
VNALPGDVAELLAAVVEALTIPLPALAYEDERAHHVLLRRRVMEVRVALATTLDFPEQALLRQDAAALRASTAKTPVTYTVWVPEQAEQDGGQPS